MARRSRIISDVNKNGITAVVDENNDKTGFITRIKINGASNGGRNIKY